VRFALLLALALAGCDLAPKQWRGWVYPNGADLTGDVRLGSFSTFQECQETALEVIRGFDRAEDTEDRAAADYECGYRCRKDDSLGGLNVCKETRK